MNAAGTVGSGVSMHPVAFGNCLGWLHLPALEQRRDKAIVLCAPIGPEGLATYRGLYDLATRCAAAGLPALRFDYPGCGDSPGGPGIGQLAACRASILVAAEWMQRQFRPRSVALIGIRLGALLAAQAAAQCPGRFPELALLEPILSGRSYLRQLQVMAQTGAMACTNHSHDLLEVGGYPLHLQEQKELAGSDLASSLRMAGSPKILLLDRRPEIAKLLHDTEAMTALFFEGAGEYFTQPHLSRIPCAAFNSVATWLAENSAPISSPLVMPAASELSADAGVSERVLRFGAEHGLVGILCRPDNARRRQVAVLVLNTGANPRAGIGRFGVRLTRRLTKLGFQSLRMDFAGVGDSECRRGVCDHAAPPDMFSDAVIEDARAGLDALTAKGERCLVVGICAGAHAAFQLARHDSRVAGVALFNLPAFDRAAGGAPALDGGPPPGDSSLTRRPRMLLRRLYAQCDMALARWFGLEAGLDLAGRWMRELAVKETRVLLAYSRGDRGLRELRAHFGRGGRQLSRSGMVRRVILNGTEHSLSPRAMQDQALCLIEEEALMLDASLSPVREAMSVEAREGAAVRPGTLMAAR